MKDDGETPVFWKQGFLLVIMVLYGVNCPESMIAIRNVFNDF